MPMGENSEKPLNDIEKGERLKCIFESLNKDKKRYEKIQAIRTLSQEEKNEYENICTRLNSFYKKCGLFIKPRKNGPGKFMTQMYINWCLAQKALDDNAPYQMNQESQYQKAKIFNNQSKLNPNEQMAINNYPSVQSQMPNKVNMNFEVNPRHMGYNKDSDSIRSNNYLSNREEDRMEYQTAPIKDVNQMPRRREHDYRQEDNYPYYFKEEYRSPKMTNPISSVNRSQPYSSNMPLEYITNSRIHPNNFIDSSPHSRPFPQNQLGDIVNMPPYSPYGAKERDRQLNEPGLMLFSDKNEFSLKNGFPIEPNSYVSAQAKNQMEFSDDLNVYKESVTPVLNHQDYYNNQLGQNINVNTSPSNPVFSNTNYPNLGNNICDYNKGGLFLKTPAEYPQAITDVPNEVKNVFHSEIQPKPNGPRIAHNINGQLNDYMPFSYSKDGVYHHSANIQSYYSNINNNINRNQAMFIENQPYVKTPTICTQKSPVTISARRKSASTSPIDHLSTNLNKKDNFSFEFTCDTRRQNNIQPKRIKIPNNYDKIEMAKEKPLNRIEAFLEEKKPEYDNMINRNMINISENFCESLLNFYKMPTNFKKPFFINPNIAELSRKSLDTFCDTNNIPRISSPEISISVMIHLDSILHKTLLISGILAQSRANHELKIEDLAIAFEKATFTGLKYNNKDEDQFEKTLEYVKEIKENYE